MTSATTNNLRAQSFFHVGSLLSPPIAIRPGYLLYRYYFYYSPKQDARKGMKKKNGENKSFAVTKTLALLYKVNEMLGSGDGGGERRIKEQNQSGNVRTQ